MHILRKTVTGRVRVPGYHHWLEAHTERSYLRSWHRHLFTVEVEVVVTGSRQVEFHDLQQQILDTLNILYDKSDGYDFGESGCEDIAAKLGFAMEKLPVVRVMVSEDDENDSTVYFGDTDV